MRTVKRILAFIAIAALLQSATPLHGQTLLTCEPQGPIIIGHFNEGKAEVGEFCRYLVKNGIQPVFQNFGNIGDAGTAKDAAAALEEGKVHVIWLGTAALAKLIKDSTLRAKVLAVSDFTVFQVIGSNPKAVSVDSSFAPTDVMVKSGRSETFADTLFIAINKPVPRCLGGARIHCDIRPREGDPEDIFSGALASFLNQESSGAVIVGSSPFAPVSPRDPVREILYVAKQSHLVGIPPATVRAMATVHGMYAEVSIPRDHYGASAPKESTPTAADPRLLISGTPPEVAERVQDFVKEVNKALLVTQPRVSREHLGISLQLVRDLGESLGGRVGLHDEYVRQLQARGLPTMQPGPPPGPGPVPFPFPFPFPGPPTPPPPPRGPSPPNQGNVAIRSFSANPSRIKSDGTSMLCWEVVNARSVRIDPGVGGLNPISGCWKTPALTAAQGRTATYTYTLSATGSDGRTTVTAQITVTVTGPPPPPPIQ